MKKQKIKILSIILIIMILLNSIMPLAQAVYVYNDEGGSDDESSLTKEEDIDKSEKYAVFELKSSPTTYKVGDEIRIDFMLKEASFESIEMIDGYYVYDDDYLQPKGTENSAFEVPNNTYGAGVGNDKYFQITQNNTSKPLKKGDIICTFKFTAKRDSSTATKFWIQTIDVTGNNKDNPLGFMGEVNDPIITLGGQEPEINIKKHSIEITKVGENLQPITETEAIFKLTIPTHTEPIIKEGKQGITKFENLDMPTTSSSAGEKTVTYTIEESKAPDGYQVNEKPINLTVTFNEDGTIKSAENGGSNVTIDTSNSNNIIKLKVENKKKTQVKQTSKFTLNVEKTNGSSTITRGSAMFKITLADNTELYKDTLNGKFSHEIEVPENVSTSDTYTYKLKEITPPDGYELNNEEITLNVKFKENVDGTYSINTVTKGTGSQATFTKGENTIDVKVKNEKIPEEQKFQIVLTKKDENEVTITSNSAKFLIIAPNSTSKIASTDTDGKITIQGTIPVEDLQSDGYTYKIQEILAPTGYKLNSDEISLNIKFAGDVGSRKISSATITSGSQAKVTATHDKEVQISVKNEKQPQEFTIKINKVDEQGNPIKKAGTLFEITNPINKKTELVQTDANGLALYKSQSPLTEGTQNFTIKERVAPSGYVLDSSEITLPLIFTKSGDKVNLTSHNIHNTTLTVDGDVTDNTITLNFKNEKEKVQVQQTYFKLIVNKKDFATGASINQKGILFKIVEQGKTDSTIKETNSNGVAQFSLPIPKNAGQVTYILTEESAPSGYERTVEKMQITATFINDDGIIKLSDISVGDSQYIQKVEGVTDNEAAVNVKNKAIPEPEYENYKIVIQKIDSEDRTDIKQKDVFFKITDPTGVASYLPTDENGRINIEYKMPTATGSHTFKIEEVKAPTGYNLYAKEQTVTVNFIESQGKVLIDGATSSGEKIDNPTISGNQVQVKISNDRPAKEVIENYTLKINTFGTDIQRNIHEGNVLYSIQPKVNSIASKIALFSTINNNDIQYISTDGLGVATYIGIRPKTAQNVSLVLKQISSPTGYVKNSQNMNINLKFEEKNGSIELTDVTINTQEGIEKIGTVENNEAQLKVLNTPITKESTEEFTLKINKIDKDTLANILQKDVVFKITNPNSEEQSILTNDGGVAIYVGKMPEDDGTKTYFIEEISGPNGYVKNPNKMKIELEFKTNSSTQKMELVNITVDESEEIKKVGLSNNIAEVQVLNTKEIASAPVEKDVPFSITINKVDSQTLGNILQKDVIFKVTDTTGRESFIGTNELGEAVYSGIIPKDAGTYTYKLIETIGPSGYIKNPNEMEISLVFTDSEGTIELTDITVNTAQGIQKVGTVSNNTAEVQVLNTKEEDRKQSFILELNKVDSQTLLNISQKDVILKLKTLDGQPNYLATNANGIISVAWNMPKTAGTIRYEIEEIKAPSGYILYSELQYIDITFGERDGQMQITNVQAVGDKIKVDSFGTNKATIKILNDAEPIVEPEPETQSFTMRINKVDSDTLTNILQSGVLFKVVNPEGQQSFYETNSNGIADVLLEMPKNAGTHRYEILEQVGPTGYIKNPNTLILDITFEEQDGKMKITNMVVNEASGIKKLNVTENGVEVQVLNTKAPTNPDDKEEPKRINLQIDKVDAETLQNIKQEGVVLKIKTLDGKSNYLATDSEGRIYLEYNMPEVSGKTKFEIEEIKAPNGYTLFSGIQYMDVTFAEENGEMKITNVEVSGEKISLTSFDADDIIVKILNDKQKSQIPDNPETKKFGIVINKVDAESLENILQSGVVFKVTNPNGEENYCTTNTNGVAQILQDMPKQAGTYRYEILELVGPNGYVKNANNLTLDITFEEQNGEMKITNMVVNEDLGIKKINVTADEVEVQVLNTKVATNPDDNKQPGEEQDPSKQPGEEQDPSKQPSEEQNPNKQPEEQKPNVQPETKQFKLKVDKYLTKVTEKYSNTGLEKVTNIPKSDNITKLDIKATELKYLTATLEYTIVVTNTGNIAGTVNSIIDQLPAKVTFDSSKNNGWVLQNGNAIYNLSKTTLQPGQSKEVVITLQYKGTQNVGTISNTATVDAVNNVVDTSNGNTRTDVDTSTLIVAIKTGQETVIYTTLTLTSLITLAVGILGIKKYVL